MYFWAHNVRINQVMGFLSGLVKEENTVTDWFNFCRDICSRFMVDNSIVLGGVGDIVEIDETKLGGEEKVWEGGGGRYLDQWVFT